MSPIERAARAISEADALLIGAGAGMGVDSGLPDFRGNHGFWQAYPPYAKLGLDFVSLANPGWFRRDPTLAWGFYGHRMELYRRTMPHAGFAILREWAKSKRHGGFVFTSNVDGQFQRSGFDPERIVQIHGAFDGMQCLDDCGIGVFSGDAVTVEIDKETMRAVPPLPICPRCGTVARPNILMFGDGGWDSAWTARQERRFSTWLGSLGGARLTIVELGAGQAIPTVRNLSERIARLEQGTRLIRINPRDPQVPTGHISIPESALTALSAIDSIVKPAT
jgi:NAD-dependent SIR2 family protein deacetylase